MVLQRLSFNFEPDNANAIKVQKLFFHSADITCGQWCSCLVTLSRGCLTITAAFSRRLDAYVCTIETNPATCGRSTVSHLRFKRTTVMSSFPAFERFARKWVKWLSSQMNLSKLAVWKMAFWPLVVHDAEFNRRNERGDGANWWFIVAMITQPASISLPLTIPSQYKRYWLYYVNPHKVMYT